MKNIGLFKRLAVITYDGLLLVAVLLVAYVPLYLTLSLAPAGFDGSTAAKITKGGYLLAISFLFYGWFWTHGGQTLGMRAWNYYLIQKDGKFLDWKLSLLRYLCAALSWGLAPALLYLVDVPKWYWATGLGFTWMLTNRARLAWHDILTTTRIVQQQPKTKA